MIPATISVDETARLLGVDRETIYDAVRRGEFEPAPIRVGRRIRIPARPLLRAVGMTDDEAAVALGLVADRVAGTATVVDFPESAGDSAGGSLDSGSSRRAGDAGAAS